ncbi:hypothetical protein DW322_18930 [Rhodococcus rhodnii]|nr:hypothetical protein DW322_18930 [Rhodococcus rhodnii]
MLRGVVAAADAATNLERPDAEVHTLGDEPRSVGPLLAQFVADAVHVAERTAGAVAPHPRWREIVVDGTTVRAPSDLDLTATGRPSTADLAARQIADLLDCGVLIAIGGHVRAVGSGGRDGWQVLVRDMPGEPSSQIALPAGGGVATASTLTPLHDDPAAPRPQWRTVSVVAPTCVDAHALATAALRRRGGAIDWLAQKGAPARLVDQEMRVITLAGWPG